MALFTEAHITQIIDAVHRHYAALGTALGVKPSVGPGQPQTSAVPLQRQLQLLVQVANGELARSSAHGEVEREVARALRALLARLMPPSPQAWRRSAPPDLARFSIRAPHSLAMLGV